MYGLIGKMIAVPGANLGLDAVDRALAKLAANPVTAGTVPQLRTQLATARRTIASDGSH